MTDTDPRAEPYRPFEFEGRRTPDADALADELPALLLGREQHWILRAAVVSEPLAEAILTVAAELIERSAAGRSVGITAARALCGRRLVPAITARMFGRGWLGTPDPGNPRHTLAQNALRAVVEIIGPSRARPHLEQAMALPELRVIAYGALAADEPEVILPHLAKLLSEAPGLAEDVAIRFALVHTQACQAACHALKGLPKATRISFGAALQRQLERIGEVRRWVECRRILTGA